eukprot:g41267.t1
MENQLGCYGIGDDGRVEPPCPELDVLVAFLQDKSRPLAGGGGAPSLRVGGDGDPESSDDDVPLVQAASRSAVSSNKGVPQQWDGAAVSIQNVVPDGTRRVRRQKGDDVRSCYMSAGQSDLPLLNLYDLEGEDVAPAVSSADLLLYRDPLDKARHSPGL